MKMPLGLDTLEIINIRRETLRLVLCFLLYLRNWFPTAFWEILSLSLTMALALYVLTVNFPSCFEGTRGDWKEEG